MYCLWGWSIRRFVDLAIYLLFYLCIYLLTDWFNGNLVDLDLLIDLFIYLLRGRSFIHRLSESYTLIIDSAIRRVADSLIKYSLTEWVIYSLIRWLIDALLIDYVFDGPSIRLLSDSLINRFISSLIRSLIHWFVSLIRWVVDLPG